MNLEGGRGAWYPGVRRHIDLHGMACKDILFGRY